MKSIKILFVMSMLIMLFVSLSATLSEEQDLSFNDEEKNGVPYSEDQEAVLLQRPSRFLTQKTKALPRGTMTCNKYPRVCHTKGSTGPDCCYKKCVNVKTDRLNCGMCGKKCKYSEICCNGKCVNPRSDKKHCGSCNKKCKKGFSCSYGMCSYA